MKNLLPFLLSSVFLAACGGQQINVQPEKNNNAQKVTANSNTVLPSDVTITRNTPTAASNADLQTSSNANKKKRDVSYLPKIEIVEPKLGKAENGEAEIVGEIKNTGDKAVKVLSIRAVYLNDQDGKISESDFPIIYENASNDDSKRHLKPKESRKFGFQIFPPPDWSNKFKLYVMEAETEN